uniref:Calcium-binding protein 39-like (Trinotate prediction) n=1 Tax=Henneguya salminicola TaxID=69463 RepID=A0A6G3MFR3_HENSL
MHFFGGKKTNPSGLVEMLVDNFTSLIASKEKESEVNKKSEKAVDFDRNLNTLCKKFLDLEPSCEIVAQLCHEIYSHDLIILMIKAIPFLDFENRKETVGILSYLLHRQVGVRMPTVDYMLSKPDSTVFELLRM